MSAEYQPRNLAVPSLPSVVPNGRIVGLPDISNNVGPDNPGVARQAGEACGGTRGSVSLTSRVSLKG